MNTDKIHIKNKETQPGSTTMVTFLLLEIQALWFILHFNTFAAISSKTVSHLCLQRKMCKNTSSPTLHGRVVDTLMHPID